MNDGRSVTHGRILIVECSRSTYRGLKVCWWCPIHK